MASTFHKNDQKMSQNEPMMEFLLQHPDMVPISQIYWCGGPNVDFKPNDSAFGWSTIFSAAFCRRLN